MVLNRNMETQARVQLFLQHIQHTKRYSPNTLEAYTRDLEQFATFLHNQYEKDDISATTHTEIRSWMVDMMQHKISPRSINRKVSVLKSLFKFLMRRGEVKKNPLSKVQTPKTSKRLPVFVEQTNIEQLLNNVVFAEGYEGALDRIIVELLYGTGMRRSELLNLKESDVDSYNAQIKVLGKGNKERLIPIHTQLLAGIKNYIAEKSKVIDGIPEGNYLLVTEKGKPLSAAMVYSTVKKHLSIVTTINKRSPHVLRHTFATHLMNNGADINAVKELLGHSSLAATQVYTHNTIEKLKNIHAKAHPKA